MSNEHTPVVIDWHNDSRHPRDRMAPRLRVLKVTFEELERQTFGFKSGTTVIRGNLTRSNSIKQVTRRKKFPFETLT